MKTFSLFIALIIGTCGSLYGQKTIIDAQAEKSLKSLTSKYEAYKDITVDFDLTIEIPERAKEVQKGKVQQQGAKYKISSDLQDIISDGTAQWVVLKEDKEVQITDIEEDDGGLSSLSPLSLLKFVYSDEFEYAITFTGKEGKKTIEQIEFKPLDEDSEFSKLRLTIDKSSNHLLRMKIFSKDSSRYTLSVKDILINQDLHENVFTFDAHMYPGVHVEDLRID